MEWFDRLVRSASIAGLIEHLLYNFSYIIR